MWDLFASLATQWRYSFGGREGLDYGPFLALAAGRGWDANLTVALLGAIEREWLEWDHRERERPGQG